MGRVIHFEIPAEKPERAVKFYQDVFGWKIDKWGGGMDYWLATTGDDKEMGINGAITTSDSIKCTANTIGVDDLDKVAKKAIAAGAKQTSPRQTIPSIGYFAYFTDTEGNVFGMLQPNPNAS